MKRKFSHISSFVNYCVRIDTSSLDYFSEEELLRSATEALYMDCIEVKIFRPRDGSHLSFEFEILRERCSDVERAFDEVIAKLTEKGQENAEKGQEDSDELPY